MPHQNVKVLVQVVGQKIARVIFSALQAHLAMIEGPSFVGARGKKQQSHVEYLVKMA